VGLELWRGTEIGGEPLEGQSATRITATGLRQLRPDSLIEAGRRAYVEGATGVIEILEAWEAQHNKAAGLGKVKRSPFVSEDVELSIPEKGSRHTRELRARARSIEQARKAPKGSTRRGRPPGVNYPPEHWERVARLYREARKTTIPALQYVADQMPCNLKTAGKWVYRCRHMEPPLLPPTTPGKARS
jgi:hypothetical protein